MLHVGNGEVCRRKYCGFKVLDVMVLSLLWNLRNDTKWGLNSKGLLVVSVEILSLI